MEDRDNKDNLCNISDRVESLDMSNGASEVHHKTSPELSTSSSLNMNGSIDDDDVDDDRLGLSLLLLPPEIIHTIIHYLDARFVLSCLSCVCRTLNQLVRDDATWKIRVAKLSSHPYPIIPNESLNWKLACIQREEFETAWRSPGEMFDYFSLDVGHIAAIDSVHLMNEGRLCLSGSRDRTMHVWDLTKLDTADKKNSVEASQVSSINGHKGWVWHISSLDSLVCTSSWDCYLKLWDAETNFTELRKIKGTSAFLCTEMSQDIVVSASFDKNIYVFDPRADYNKLPKIHIHTAPVLSLVVDSNYIISASEDKTVAIYDRRGDHVYKRLKFKSFPMSLSYGNNQLWAGLKNGSLHLINTRSGLFDIVQEYDPGHTGKVTGIYHNLGGVYTCSTDRTIKIHAPTHPLETKYTLDNHSADVTSITFQNRILASASGDITVGIWKPKDWTS